MKKIKFEKPTTIIPLYVNYKDATWHMTIGVALGTILQPALIILSRLLKKEIEFMKKELSP